ncbi:MAG: lysylphosphatidylglycerol synthase transmembrane domain-containing protein [Gammaproteobacteria bacterium]
MLKFIIKLLVSLTILFILVQATDTENLKRSLYSVEYDAIFYALFLIVLIRFIMALRWKVLLHFYQISASLKKLFGIIFVSNALGHLLPSGLGTDIIRVYELSKNKGSSEKILASVFLDRVFGLISMLLVALLAAWYAFFSNQLKLAIPLLITISSLILPVIFIFTRYFLSKNVSLKNKNRFAEKTIKFYNRFLFALQQTSIPLYGYYSLTALSVLVQLIRCLIFMTIFMGLGSEIAIIHYFVFVPIVFILMLIPVSIGGLGIRESALFAFFGPLGLSISTCTVAGLIFHALQLVMIIPGLIIFNLRK